MRLNLHASIMRQKPWTSRGQWGGCAARPGRMRGPAREDARPGPGRCTAPHRGISPPGPARRPPGPDAGRHAARPASLPGCLRLATPGRGRGDRGRPRGRE